MRTGIWDPSTPDHMTVVPSPTWFAVPASSWKLTDGAMMNSPFIAARLAITQEIKGVFGVYGITSDARHLGLVADYMTFSGGYKPLNRMGIGNSASPFLRMTFETSMNFMTDSALRGDHDDLTSPSSKIVLGQVVESGTGGFELRQPLEWA